LKQLLLIRHAKSSWDDEGFLDLERPLSKRGKKDAKLLGRLLLKSGITPQFVISSPAVRAIKTANKLAKELNYPKDKIKINSILYSGHIPELLNLVRSLDNKIDRVFMIGHNPELLEFGNYLANSNIEKLTTCGFVFINFKTISWNNLTSANGKIMSIN
jgi:phosphohistidine phosphatase